MATISPTVSFPKKGLGNFSLNFSLVNFKISSVCSSNFSSNSFNEGTSPVQFSGFVPGEKMFFRLLNFLDR